MLIYNVISAIFVKYAKYKKFGVKLLFIVTKLIFYVII